MGQHKRPPTLGPGSSAENEWVINPRGWTLPTFLCKPSFSSLGLTAFSAPTPTPSFRSFPPPTGCSAPRFLVGGGSLLQDFRVYWRLASVFCALGSVMPHPLLYCPVTHHPEGLTTPGHLSFERVSMGYWELHPLPLNSTQGLRERVCLGQTGGRSLPPGEASPILPQDQLVPLATGRCRDSTSR